jgi:EmrB/QacA subfamily drug resistance transporter
MDMLTSDLPCGRRTVLPPRTRLVPLIIGSALLMQGIDGTAITVALPAMAQSLGSDPLRLNLAISTYLLSIAVFIPASAWVAERFGARATFCNAIAIFVLASVLCGLSQNLVQLIAARILQGLGGALMTPVGRLVLLRTVPRANFVRAISLFTVPALIGPVLGAPLGGLIVEMASWHWIFFINVPLGVIGIVATLRHVPKLQSAHPGPFDLLGFLLLGLGLSAITFAVAGVGGYVSPVSAAALLCAGAVALFLYTWHAGRTKRPVLDLNLLATRSFRIVVIFGSLWRASMAGLPILIALLLQLGFGLGPLATGLIVFSSAAGALLMKAGATPILNRFGFRRVMIANAFVTGGFAAAYGLFNIDTPHATIIAALFVGGVFRSIQYTSLGTLAFADLPDEAMSRASAFASTAQEMAQSVGISIAALLVHGAMLILGTAQAGAVEIRIAFVVTAIFAFVSALGFARLKEEDGIAIRTPYRANGRPTSQAE